MKAAIGLDECPDAALDVFFDEILCSGTTLETVAGVYAVALPALCGDIRHYIQTTNPLVDAPSSQLLKRAVDDLDSMIASGGKSIGAVAAASPEESVPDATAHFSRYLAIAGGADLEKMGASG